MRVLVLGGAGYIGSHMLRFLQDMGPELACFDNLSTGHQAAVGKQHFYQGDLSDLDSLKKCLQDFRPEIILHFAARSIVPESIAEPALYYANNVGGTIQLLQAMRDCGCEQLIFSSSAAVYGHQEQEGPASITETAPTAPVSAYGRSKLWMEQLIADCAKAYGLKAIALRYFNACGADPSGEIGEAHEPETHLIPNILRSLGPSAPDLRVFGLDHPTPDGSCIRDYVHVNDLCAAHWLAAKRLGQASAGSLEIFNLGHGTGHSVLEVIDTASTVIGREISYTVEAARAGDPARLVADAGKARRELGWQCQYDLQDIIASAWRWHQNPAYGISPAI